MPTGGITWVLRVVHDCHTDRFAFHRTPIVHPRRAFAPHVAVLLAFTVEHVTLPGRMIFGLLETHRFRDPDCHGTFLRIAEYHILFSGSECYLDVEKALICGTIMDTERLNAREHDSPIRSLPFE